jgi:hypothetical protein
VRRTTTKANGVPNSDVGEAIRAILLGGKTSSERANKKGEYAVHQLAAFDELGRQI